MLRPPFHAGTSADVQEPDENAAPAAAGVWTDRDPRTEERLKPPPTSRTEQPQRKPTAQAADLAHGRRSTDLLGLNVQPPEPWQRGGAANTGEPSIDDWLPPLPKARPVGSAAPAAAAGSQVPAHGAEAQAEARQTSNEQAARTGHGAPPRERRATEAQQASSERATRTAQSGAAPAQLRAEVQHGSSAQAARTARSGATQARQLTEVQRGSSARAGRTTPGAPAPAGQQIDARPGSSTDALLTASRAAQSREPSDAHLQAPAAHTGSSGAPVVIHRPLPLGVQPTPAPRTESAVASMTTPRPGSPAQPQPQSIAASTTSEASRTRVPTTLTHSQPSQPIAQRTQPMAEPPRASHGVQTGGSQLPAPQARPVRAGQLGVTQSAPAQALQPTAAGRTGASQLAHAVAQSRVLQASEPEPIRTRAQSAELKRPQPPQPAASAPRTADATQLSGPRAPSRDAEDKWAWARRAQTDLTQPEVQIAQLQAAEPPAPIARRGLTSRASRAPSEPTRAAQHPSRASSAQPESNRSRAQSAQSGSRMPQSAEPASRASRSHPPSAPSSSTGSRMPQSAEPASRASRSHPPSAPSSSTDSRPPRNAGLESSTSRALKGAQTEAIGTLPHGARSTAAEPRVRAASADSTVSATTSQLKSRETRAAEPSLAQPSTATGNVQGAAVADVSASAGKPEPYAPQSAIPELSQSHAARLAATGQGVRSAASPRKSLAHALHAAPGTIPELSQSRAALNAATEARAARAEATAAPSSPSAAAASTDAYGSSTSHGPRMRAAMSESRAVDVTGDATTGSHGPRFASRAARGVATDQKGAVGLAAASVNEPRGALDSRGAHAALADSRLPAPEALASQVQSELIDVGGFRVEPEPELDAPRLRLDPETLWGSALHSAQVAYGEEAVRGSLQFEESEHTPLDGLRRESRRATEPLPLTTMRRAAWGRWLRAALGGVVLGVAASVAVGYASVWTPWLPRAEQMPVLLTAAPSDARDVPREAVEVLPLDDESAAVAAPGPGSARADVPAPSAAQAEAASGRDELTAQANLPAAPPEPTPPHASASAARDFAPALEPTASAASNLEAAAHPAAIATAVQDDANRAAIEAPAAIVAVAASPSRVETRPAQPEPSRTPDLAVVSQERSTPAQPEPSRTPDLVASPATATPPESSGARVLPPGRATDLQEHAAAVQPSAAAVSSIPRVPENAPARESAPPPSAAFSALDEALGVGRAVPNQPPPPAPEPAAAAASADPPVLLVKPLGAAESGLPEQPSREQVRDTMLAMHASLAACAAGKHGTTFANVTVQPDGRVSYSLIDGAFAGTEAGSCMARTLRSAMFPRFAGPPFKVRYPLVF